MSYKFTVTKPTYERRLARMVELIEMKAPAIIIHNEALMIVESYQTNLWERLRRRWMQTRIGLAIWSFFNPLSKEMQAEIDEAMDDDAGLTNAELMARDLQDPSFIDTLSPEQLGRFVNDIANAKPGRSYDEEAPVKCICPPNEVSLECPVCTH